MFGNRLRDLRKRLDLSQAQLAVAAGIGQTYLSALERNVATNPSREVMQALARVLGVPIAELAEAVWSETANQLQDEGLPEDVIRELGTMWPDLTEDDRETALAMTRALWERRKAKNQSKPTLEPLELPK